MRRTTEHRPYVGLAAVLSRHDLSRACRSTDRRLGFTLVEVVVAAAILLILIIGLAGVFARGVTGFKQAQLLTLAQNLAEFQVEDLKNLAPSALNQLANHTYLDVNYPYAVQPSAGDPDYVEKLAMYHFDHDNDWAYDSGKIQTDFKVDGIEQLGDSSLGFLAGRDATAIPSLPTDTAILLGNNIVVAVYLEDTVSGLTYWKDSEEDGWYHLDSGENPVYGPAPVTPPFQEGDFMYYYLITLQKEAYPLFSRQVRITQYDASTPDGSDVWSALLDEQYRIPQGDTRTKFEYEITIWYKQNGVDRVLFRSGGTIAVPIAGAGTGRSVA